MDPDTSLVVGMVLIVLCLPSVVSALSEGRAPRAAAVVLVVGLGLMVYATQLRTYSLDEVPDVFFRVIARFTG